MSDLRVKTHWVDCWKDSAHHGCALARIRELEAALTDLYSLVRKQGMDDVSAYDGSLDWLFWIKECVRHLERTGDTQLATEVRNEYETMRSMLRCNAQLEAALRQIADKADDPRHVSYEEACIAKAALAGLALDRGEVSASWYTVTVTKSDKSVIKQSWWPSIMAARRSAYEALCDELHGIGSGATVSDESGTVVWWANVEPQGLNVCGQRGHA